MKNKIIKVLIAIAVIFTSCTNDFEDINTNPNNPDKAPLNNVFAYTIQSISGRFGTTEMEYPASYVGHVTKGTYTDVTRYSSSPNASVWSETYGRTLTNLNLVIDGATKEENNVLLGAALVLKAYAMQMLTDIYGPVPYTDAGKAAEGIINPAYDTEATIYYALLDELEKANGLLVDSETPNSFEDGDLLYGGDITKWKKFCNSLRLRLAIRISNVDATKATSVISTVLGNTGANPVFESNDDNAKITFPGDDWIEPWTARHSSIGDDKIAKPIVDVLLAYNDPRIVYYAETLDDGTTYRGLEVGAEADIEYSNVNDLFVNNPTGSVYFMKYAEIEFIKAEAYNRSLVTGDAKAAYEAGITASCEEYGVSTDDINNYLLEAEVVYNNLTQIYTQKWIALFRQSWEAWAEMRRTDIPTLSAATNSTHSGHNRPPFRFSYPDSERNLNAANIPANVNEDDNYWGYQIWWDTRTGVQ